MNLGSSDHSLQVTFFIYPTFNLSVELGTCEVKHGSNKECKTLENHQEQFMYCSHKEEQPKGAGDAGEQRG